MRTIQELEQVILDIISKIYCKKFTGKMEIIPIGNDLGYTLKLELNKSDKPFSVSIEGSQETFLKQVEEELRLARLNTVEYFEAIQL
jgi:hypothetical protein